MYLPIIYYLEPLCCKKCQKSPCPETGLRMSEDSKWSQIGPKWARVNPIIIYGQFGIIQSLQRSPIPQTSISWQGLFYHFLQQGGSIEKRQQKEEKKRQQLKKCQFAVAGVWHNLKMVSKGQSSEKADE